jgi:hypothetical protein
MSLSSRMDKLEARRDASIRTNGVVLIMPCKEDSGHPEGSMVVIRPDRYVGMPWISTVVTPDRMHLYPELFHDIEPPDHDVAGRAPINLPEDPRRNGREHLDAAEEP